MKEEEPISGKKSEDEGIEKENLAILEKIRKTQRQDHLNVSVCKHLELLQLSKVIIGNNRNPGQVIKIPIQLPSSSLPWL